MNVTRLNLSKTTCTTVPLALGNFLVSFRKAAAGITASVVSSVARAMVPFSAFDPNSIPAFLGIEDRRCSDWADNKFVAEFKRGEERRDWERRGEGGSVLETGSGVLAKMPSLPRTVSPTASIEDDLSRQGLGTFESP